jgi:ribosomal protein L11 methyltransferase
MSWTEIVVEVARNQAESLSDALMEAGALSVSVEDADLGTAAEQPLFGEPGMVLEQAAWERSRVVALVDENSDYAALIAAASEASNLEFVPAYDLRSVAEQDWVRLTQSQFEPIHIGKNIWVVPSWHDAPDPAALILELDPGLAFGTGSHPTTRLCMEWLESNVAAQPSQPSVLDYGCGSGILALVAKKVGADTVIGVDIDPQALQSAEFNSSRNHCQIDYLLPDDFARAYPAGTRFDIVVANILSGPLMLMAPMLASRVAPGGALVLSGILAAQAESVIASYAPYIALNIVGQLDGWVALSGKLADVVATTTL